MILLRFFLELIFFISVLLPSLFLKKNLNFKKLARVNKEFLKQEDLPKSILDEKDLKQKKQFIQKYVTKWIEKKITIAEIESILEQQQTIELKNIIDNYKYELFTYKYLDNALDEKFGSLKVTEKEIVDYYDANKSNFELKNNIVRGKFAIIPRKIKNSNDLRTLFISSQEKDQEHLYDYCTKFAKSYFLNSDVWIKFDSMIKNTPLENTKDKLALIRQIKNRNIYSLIGKENIYYFEIKEYKISDQISPLDFVRNKIKDIIIFKKKATLEKEILNELLQKAKKNIDYEKY